MPLPCAPRRPSCSLPLAQLGRWKADAGAAFPPPAAPRGRPSPRSRSFRAPRPSEVPGSPFHRRSAPLGAPCGARISPSGSGLRPDRDTFAEFPGLFPAPSLALSRSVCALALRRLAHIGTPRSRSAHTSCHPRASRAKGPRETSHNSPGRVGEVAALASLAPSRRLLDADWRAALRRSAEASGACIRHARIAFDSWSGRRAPAETRKEPT